MPSSAAATFTSRWCRRHLYRARGIYDCHGHPFLSSLGSGWHRRLRAAWWIVLFPQGDPPHTNHGTTTKDLADNALTDRLTVNRLSKSDQTSAS